MIGRPSGAAPPILLLHGMPDTGRVWDGVRAVLEPELPSRAPNLPGFGGSGAPSRLAGLGDLVASVDALAIDLTAPLVLVVHDVGCLFGLAWAAMRRDRVAALVVLNAGVVPDRRWHWGARILRTPLLGELAIGLTNLPAFRRELRRASNGGRDDAEIARTFEAFDATARATALYLYRLQTPRLLGELAALLPPLTAQVPTLVIWGDRDPYLPTAYAERLGAQRTIHHADLGHWPHVEAPAQVAADIRAFVAASAGAGSVP